MNGNSEQQINFFDINIVYISNNISDFEQIKRRVSDVLEKIQKNSDKADITTPAVPD